MRNLLLPLITFILLSSCSVDLEENNLIDRSKPVNVSIVTTDSLTGFSKTESYSINTNSDKWKSLSQWAKDNKEGWQPTPASYIGDLYLIQDNFKLAHTKGSKAVVINFVDSNGEPKQYSKAIKKGEFDYLFKYVKPIEQTDLEIHNWKDSIPSKHSFFIDTSRTSKFYQRIIKWAPHKYDNQGIDYYLKELAEKEPIKNFQIEPFPKLWISLRQYKNKLFLYGRCDGIDRRFGLTDSTFIYYGPLESDADVIDSLILNNESELKLQLRTIPQKSKSGYSTVSIKRAGIDHVWVLSHVTDGHEWNELITPKTDITYFEMIVNHCPESKEIEYQKFDSIDFEKYK